MYPTYPNVFVWRRQPTVSSGKITNFELIAQPSFIHFWRRQPSARKRGSWTLYTYPANIIVWKRQNPSNLTCSLDFELDLECIPPAAINTEDCNFELDLSCIATADIAKLDVDIDLTCFPGGGFFPGTNVESLDISIDLSCNATETPGEALDILIDLTCVPHLDAVTETCFTGHDDLPTVSPGAKRWF